MKHDWIFWDGESADDLRAIPYLALLNLRRYVARHLVSMPWIGEDLIVEVRYRDRMREAAMRSMGWDE